MMKLGIKVRDKISGFTGIVTGFVTYISGCNQALVAPLVKDDGSLGDSLWFDVQRLERIGSETIKLDNGPTPGPDRAAPKR